MELLLNILWVLIAVGLVAIWRTRWIHQRRRSSRRSLQECSAIGIALVLLFFAVSMTDDLHSEIVALEEWSISKRDSVCSPGPHVVPQSGTPLHASSWAIAPPVSCFAGSDAEQKLEQASEISTSFLPSYRPSGRAPPVSFL